MQLGLRYGDLFQMSYITRDMDAAVAHCEKELGITNFSVMETGAPVLSGGKVQEIRLNAAIANIGRHQFEILQPLSGPTHVYTDAVDLDAHIINFHHIAIAVRGGYDRFQALLAEVRESGDEIAFLHPPEDTGEEPVVAFMYVDTRGRLGHYTEYLWWSAAMEGQPAIPKLDA
jgi:hypothetical protein